ncbi:hypothetical protein JW921_09695 [Candidatus Fermentibacterales bacterium]|nr:hypothetical protein [Candidatus Fermentibacterales bacterium]
MGARVLAVLVFVVALVLAYFLVAAVSKFDVDRVTVFEETELFVLLIGTVLCFGMWLALLMLQSIREAVSKLGDGTQGKGATPAAAQQSASASA